MANKKSDSAPETTGLEELNDSLTNVTKKVQDNQKIIVTCSLVVVFVAVLVIAYVYFFRNPSMQKHNDNIGNADLELALGNDSVALAQYTDLADNGSFEASNRAALQSAILLYQQGKYEEALKYADKYSPREEIIGAGALSLKGDCLVNLDRLDEAVKAYEKAVSVSDDNPAYTPFFLVKLARVYHAQNNYTAEADAYARILKDYPLYGQAHNLDVEKLLDRANLLAGKK